MATELGVAYLSLAASTGTFAKDVYRTLGDAEKQATQTGKRVGSSLGSGIASAMKVGTAAVASLAGAIGGLALKGGFDRALAIDNAQAKMKALGYTSSDVASVMDTALASVKGTAFGLGDAASLATQYMAAGVKPGNDLARALGNAADAAAVANVPLSDVSSVFMQLASSDHLYTQDLLQLQQRGLPVFIWLSETLGKTTGEIRKMVSAGQVGFGDLQAAIEQHIGGAAKATDSFMASWSNVKAALSRAGATFATPALASLKGVFDQAIPSIDKVTSLVTPLADTFSSRVAPAIQSVADQVSKFIATADFGKIAGQIGALSGALLPLGGLFGALASSGLKELPILGKFIPVVAGPMGLLAGAIAAVVAASPGLRTALGGALSALTPTLSALTPAFQSIGTLATTLAGAIGDALAGAVTALTPALSVLADLLSSAIGVAVVAIGQVLTSVLIPALDGLGGLLSGQSEIVSALGIGILAVVTAMKAWSLATTIWSGVTKVAAAVQAAFNVVMDANPIAIVVLAIAGLVAGLTYFFTQTETGRQVWASFTTGLGVAWQWLQGVASTVWSAIQSAASTVVTWWQANVSPVFAAFGELFAAVGERISQVWQLTVAGAQVFWNALSPIFDAVGKAWSLMWTGIQVIWEKVGPPLIAGIRVAIENAQAIWSAVWSVVGSVFSGIWNAIRITVETVLKVITGVIKTATALIKGDWSGAWDAIKGTFSAAWDGINRLAQNAVSTLGNIIGTIKDTILGIFRNAGDWLKDIGGKIIDGLVSGIKGAFQKVKDTLSNLTDLLPDWKGPAERDRTLLAPAGELLMGGLVKGIEAGYGDVRRSLMGITADLPSQVRVPDATVKYGAAPKSSGDTTFNIYEQSDPESTSAAVQRRLAMLGRS